MAGLSVSTRTAADACNRSKPQIGEGAGRPFNRSLTVGTHAGFLLGKILYGAIRARTWVSLSVAPLPLRPKISTMQSPAFTGDRNGENSIDLILKRCFAVSSGGNPVHQGYAHQVQRIFRKPGLHRLPRCWIRNPLAVEVLGEYPAPSRKQIEIIHRAPRFAGWNRPEVGRSIKRAVADVP